MRNTTNGSKTSPSDDERDLSEGDYLATQAESAKETIAETLERMRADMKDSVDLPAWTRKYPWPSVGLAAAFGFMAVKTLSAPAKPSASDASMINGHAAQAAAPAQTSLFSNLMMELARNLMTALQGIIAAAVSAKFSAATNQRDGANGVETQADASQPTEDASVGS